MGGVPRGINWKTLHLALSLSSSLNLFSFDDAFLCNLLSFLPPPLPQVRCYVGDNEQRWFMWYSARDSPAPADGSVAAVAPGAGAVGVATSGDGVLWRRWSPNNSKSNEEAPPPSSSSSPILEPNGDWWWHDTHHVSVSDVQIFSSGAVASTGGVYWMFYSGGSFEKHALPEGITSSSSSSSRSSSSSSSSGSSSAEVEGARTRAGLALSQDGRHWARIEADHHTGALLDAGEEGRWDSSFIAAPQVVAAGPRDMRMYYHSFDERTRKWTVGVSLSEDGLKWSRGEPVFCGGGGSGEENDENVENSTPSSPSSFDAAGAASRHVVFDSETKQYVMVYEAVARDDERSIGVAVSKDGLRGWRRVSDKPVLEASSSSSSNSSSPSSSWDDGGVGAPCLVPMAGGKWRLYYSGRAKGSAPGAWCGVGLALMASDDDDEGENKDENGDKNGKSVGGGLAHAKWRRRSGAPPPGVVARGVAAGVAAGAAV